jgi:hypothetical protein
MEHQLGVGLPSHACLVMGCTCLSNLCRARGAANAPEPQIQKGGGPEIPNRLKPGNAFFNKLRCRRANLRILMEPGQLAHNLSVLQSDESEYSRRSSPSIFDT